MCLGAPLRPVSGVKPHGRDENLHRTVFVTGWSAQWTQWTAGGCTDLICAGPCSSSLIDGVGVEVGVEVKDEVKG